MMLTKEDIDKVRAIEGFPIASDEDIIALSNPPYYTACPNLFIEDFIKEHGKPYDEETDDYHREPFAADVSEGKSDAIYNAHTYHTKVPYKAIMRYILHYTKPGDMIFDGFCGTGMTGVAAQMCETPEPQFKFQIEQEMGQVQWGKRYAVLNDLSPAAAFIAYNYNNPIDVSLFEEKALSILKQCSDECSWMYETNHVEDNNQIKLNALNVKGKINYTVWSDVFICPNCSNELIFWDVAVDKSNGKVFDTFICNKCSVELSKKDCERAKTKLYDKDTNEIVEMVKQVPVLINYIVGKKHYNKQPDESDLDIIKKIESLTIPYWFPTHKMMLKGDHWGDSWRSGIHSGITRVNHFFYKRTLFYLSKFFDLLNNNDLAALKILFTSQIINLSKLNRYRPQVSFPYNPLSGTMYISSMVCESNPEIAYRGKVKKFLEALKDNKNNSVCVSVNSTTKLLQPDNSADYIFTDPPFGDNLMYSELSFLWEAWLKVITNNNSEAIINNSQGKGINEYKKLMTQCFSEYYRVLKPNRWITIEFHNSKNAVWNSIQEALQKSGFIVADVRTLDKKQGSFKQVTTTSAVKQDLVISAYKPKDSFIKEIRNIIGREDTAWVFVRQHLENLPVVVLKNNKIEIVNERQAFLLFDRMVAYHILNGIPMPLDSIDFYKGLDDKFLKRDGMYFLPDQVNEYDNARIINDIEPIQFELFVTNEKSAIAWLYQQLGTPQTYGQIQPKFMQEAKTRDKYEIIPDLSVLLEENFLQNENGQWYIPNTNKQSDIIKLRDKKLWKEFEGYLSTKGKLKLFRTEAIRVGFSKLWTEKNYKLIVETAERLPEAVIQEDDKLLMYYDISLGRL